MRITPSIVIQDVEEAGVVICDERTGEEIVIPPEAVEKAGVAFKYFANARKGASLRAPEPPDPYDWVPGDDFP